MKRRVLRRRYGRGVAAYNRGSRLISRQISGDLAGRVKDGRYCGGVMYNGPDKRYTRCSRCKKIDWEKNEGDRCDRVIA